MVEKQPIGKLLFEQFCNTDARYAKAWAFLSKIEEYETSDDDCESRRTLAKSIASFLSVESDSPCVCVSYNILMLRLFLLNFFTVSFFN